MKKIPNKLYVCLLKTRSKVEGWEGSIDELKKEQAVYMTDLWYKGIFWAGGPSAGGKPSIEIYSVNTIEEAQKAQRNAPLYTKGFLFADEYLEWTPKHWPPPTPDIDPSSGVRHDH
jgi:hypothetical protein